MKKIEKTKWQLKREALMENQTYRVMIQRAEGDAEMMHRIVLAMVVKKQQPGQGYRPLWK